MSIRSWASAYTREGRFSPVGVAFHWVMAALILFQLGLGWFLKLMGVGGDKLAAYALHGTIGVLIFLLAFLRIIWRLMIPDPFNDADRQGWTTKFAYVIEHLFYLCFLMLPLTGWAMWSAIGEPASITVWIAWPSMPFHELESWRQWEILYLAETLHLAFVWLLMLMIPLHVGAALKHHFWDRNDVLKGMLPEVPDAEPRRAGSRQKPTARQPPPE